MFLFGIGGGRTWPSWTVQNLATDQGPRQAHTLSLSKLFRNVPIVNLLEMSPLLLIVAGVRAEAKPSS